ncbi:MAG: hypothetical protein PSU89_16865, partial [Methylobacter sp.]|nr:hypothetical protein [Methylobacter sp.]MDI1359962.1 hypothetical protein [Methylobacter sp.]
IDFQRFFNRGLHGNFYTLLALLPESVERIMSVYNIETEKLWVITDPDRKVTTLLTEEDF